MTVKFRMQAAPVQSIVPKIWVVGVGGGGGNGVDNMINSGLEGCEYLVCNSDMQALERSLCFNKVQLGVHVTGGLGAGSKPEIGRAAAEETLDEVMKHLEGANMVFVTAGMGGGTGTGAAPVIAKACRERGILTVGVVTKPFHFEGSHRMRSAEAGIREMQDVVDTLIVIPNQNLFRVANEKTTFAQAFQMADGVLQAGVRGVTDLMIRPGLVNLDFADIRTAMMEMGKAMMGTGEAKGDKRAIEAAEAAINNPLLDDVSMKGAHGVIINVTGGYDMTLFEADEACNRIRDEVDPEANIIFGATFDESLDGIMRVSIVATGIEKESDSRRKTNASGGKIDVKGKPVLERAQPRTEVAASQAPVFIPAQSSRPFSAPPALAAQQTMARASVAQIAPQPQPQSHSHSHSQQRAELAPVQILAQNTPVPDPEVEMFEQQEFIEAIQTDRHDSQQNAAMRGARYKDSFIPPPPAVPQEDPAAATFVQRTGGFHGGAPVAQHLTSSLTLNPPKLPQQQQRGRSPSLFERIGNSVQQAVESFRDEGPVRTDRPHQAPQMSSQISPTAQGGHLPRPSQGTLNIDVPAARPRTEAESELDIPAFLRRQAN